MTLLALGEVFVCVKRFYSLSERIGVEMFRARKSVYRLYDSYATFDRTGGGDEGAGRSGDPAPIADARPDGVAQVPMRAIPVRLLSASHPPRSVCAVWRGLLPVGLALT